LPHFTEARAIAPSIPAAFVRTSTVKLIEVAFQRAKASSMIEPIAIIGEPGVGKTTALAHLATTHPDIAFITAMPTNRRLKTFLAAMVDAFGIRTDAKFASDFASELERALPQLAGRGWSLIVDEVQVLDSDAVFQLCKYAELFRLQVIFAGNSHALKRTRANASAIEQIRSRVSTWVTIDGVTEADIVEFGVNANVEGKDAYALLSRYGLKTSLREVVRLLEAARACAGKSGPLRRQAIAEGLALLLGPRDAAPFLIDRAA
jgi:DNA transposition AAA+ family ATPase